MSDERFGNSGEHVISIFKKPNILSRLLTCLLKTRKWLSLWLIIVRRSMQLHWSVAEKSIGSEKMFLFLSWRSLESAQSWWNPKHLCKRHSCFVIVSLHAFFTIVYWNSHAVLGSIWRPWTKHLPRSITIFLCEKPKKCAQLFRCISILVTRKKLLERSSNHKTA